MKKLISILCFIFITNYTFASIYNFDNKYEDENEEVIVSTVPKTFYAEVGLGWNGLSLAAGLRYWQIGFSMGINGLANGMPNYAQYLPNINISQNQPLPSGFVEEKYVGLIVTGDVSIFWGYLGGFVLSSSVGYYSQADSILAYNVQTGDRVRWKTEVHSGITFGLGFDYPIYEEYFIGLVAHTKRGIGLRFTYIWY